MARDSRLVTPLHHHSTIHHNRLPGEKRRLVRSQEQRSRGHVFWFTPAPERRHLNYLLSKLGIRLLAECSFDESRGQNVHPNCRSHVPRQRSAEARDSPFGGGVYGGILAWHALADVVPGHVDDGAASLFSHEVDGRP